jgi:hypothetical protein
VLVALNPADPARLPFATTVVREARPRGMGVIAMKILGHGRILDDRAATLDELVAYATSLADTSIVGCGSPAEVRANLEAGRRVEPMLPEARAALEARLSRKAARYAYFKAER